MDEQQCEQHYAENFKRAADGAFVVRIPFKPDNGPEKLGESRGQALARFLQLEKRFVKDKQLQMDYVKVIQELEMLNKILNFICLQFAKIGASIIVIHEKGAVQKDNRFQLFDKIIEIDGKKITSETSEIDFKKTFQRCYGKVKMVVYRADPSDLKEIDVDVTKKSGKDLGVGFAECKGHGIYITDFLAFY